MAKPKILFMSPFATRMHGGVGAVTELLFKELNQQGRVEAAVATFFPYKQNGTLVNRSVHLYAPSTQRPETMPKRTFPSIDSFLQSVPPGAYDVVHFHGIYFGEPYGGMDAIERRFAGVPKVTTTHFVLMDPKQQHNPHDTRFRVYDASDALVCFSVFGRESVINGRKDLREKTILIPNGVELPLEHGTRDTLRRTTAPGAPPISPDDLVLLYVGRIAERKGLERIAEAFPAIHQHARTALRKRARLVIVGDGNPNIKNYMATRLGAVAGDVYFAGRIMDPVKLGEWYRRADLVLVPSDYESFSLSAADAMIRGIPVAITANSAPKELFVDPGLAWGMQPTTRSLTDTVVQVMGKLDGREAGTMCRRAQTTAATEYSIKTVAGKTAELYERLTKGNGYEAAVRLMRYGRNTEALAAFQRLPKDTVREQRLVGTYMFGCQRAVKGDVTGAITAFNQVVVADPQHIRAHYEMAQLLARQRNYAGARHAVATVLRIDPSYEPARALSKTIGAGIGSVR
ncbi:MAG: glycosyltransferase [Candidatus Woesearchaeota archaeon]|nr:glycosyltransferase [Candidatus Woesearchaeota archaeon]